MHRVTRHQMFQKQHGTTRLLLVFLSAALVFLTGCDHRAKEACKSVLTASVSLKKNHLNPQANKLLLQMNHSLLQFLQIHKIQIKKAQLAELPKTNSDWVSSCENIFEKAHKTDDDFPELAIELLTLVMKHWDPHSLAVSTETLSAETSLTDGYGFRFEREDLSSPLDIVDVVAGSPAHNAGLQEGMQIWTIEGENVSALRTSAIYSRLNSLKKDVIHLGVQAAPHGPLKKYTISRGRFETSPFKFETLQLFDSKLQAFNTGYVRFRSFVGAQAFFAEALKSLRKTSASLILDLRNISGGEIRSIAPIIDHLIPNLIEFVGFRCTPPKAQEPVQLQDASSLWDVPIIVLVNSSTKSAAEILAAALQDYGAIVVGSQTFGKGTQQKLISLQDYKLPGAAFVTDAFTVRPSGRTFQLEGVTPDILLPTARAAKLERHYPHSLHKPSDGSPLYGFDRRNLFSEIQSLKPELVTLQDAVAQKTQALLTTTTEEDAYLQAAEAVAVFLKEHYSDATE